MADPFMPRSVMIDGAEKTFESIDQLEQAIDGEYEALRRMAQLDADELSRDHCIATRQCAEQLRWLIDFHQGWARDIEIYEEKKLRDAQQKLQRALQELPDSIFKRATNERAH